MVPLVVPWWVASVRSCALQRYYYYCGNFFVSGGVDSSGVLYRVAPFAAIVPALMSAAYGPYREAITVHGVNQTGFFRVIGC